MSARQRGSNRRRTPGPRSSRTETPPVQEVGNVRIEAIAAGGDGIGRVDGIACFVPRTAPGDTAQVAFSRHARLARGRVLQLLDASAARVEPRCRHYVVDRCGGCQLQHLADDVQQDARTTIVVDAMRRIAKREVETPTLHAGARWEYRGRLTLTLIRRGSGWVGGLHPYDDATRVFALEECPISHPALVATWRALHPFLRSLPVAPTLRLGLRLASESAQHGESRVAVVIRGGSTWPDAEAWSAGVRSSIPSVGAVVWERDGGREVRDGARTFRPLHEGHVDDLAPDAAEAVAFAQVNSEVAAALRAWTLDAVRSFAPTTVVDGYAGVGLLTESLARDGIRSVAIEADPAATAAARQRMQGIMLAEVITATVEAALPLSLPADVVVLNPPRRGVDASVVERLRGADREGTRAIVYVSCDPATLARDLARLARWRVASLRCFDMFPQTAHVETVCVLVPEES